MAPARASEGAGSAANRHDQIGHSRANQGSRHPEDLGSRGGCRIEGEHATPEPVAQGHRRTHRVPTPAADGVGGETFALLSEEITLHRGKPSERTPPDTGETRVTVLSPLPSKPVPLISQTRRRPGGFRGGQGQHLMARQDGRIARRDPDHGG